MLPEDLAKRRGAESKKAVRRDLLERFTKLAFVPRGAAGLRQAEVCRGGVDCSGIEPLTFFSRLHPRPLVNSTVLPQRTVLPPPSSQADRPHRAAGSFA